MSVPEAPSINYHPYSHALQIRVYQAFIFSIPILFSIILFLLFYLFYLKRRAYAISSSPPTLPPSTFNYATSFLPMSHHVMGLKGDLKDKLPKVIFGEDLKAKDSLCCVCLGEFEMNEELIQVPSCKHIFHRDCIHHWLQSNSTCPLCRCCVFLAVGPLSLPVVGPPTEPHSSGDDDDPPTEGTTCEAQGTTTTTAAASSSNSNCLRVSSNSSHVSSGLSVVIHVGVGPQ
ncbi:probable E3 ubiquitin-protein ligase RHA4A [Cynara cardunculus var. scolymus]|uniref:probable E3 ubiquitin-protein ligase RHA4A n=1 Tax=Cynara cardunculus var. scolymus TaxID=59895 RepID=UPI000D629B6A|nr:probable E3 ubiquitin-protein ligase RHA4A [Cynara cardunculus var. scolymus]